MGFGNSKELRNFCESKRMENGWLEMPFKPNQIWVAWKIHQTELRQLYKFECEENASLGNIAINIYTYS